MRTGVLAGLARNRTSYHNNFTQAGLGRKYRPGMMPWAWEFSQRCFTPVFRFRTICGLWCIGIQLGSCCLLPTSEKKRTEITFILCRITPECRQFQYGLWILDFVPRVLSFTVLFWFLIWLSEYIICSSNQYHRITNNCQDIIILSIHISQPNLIKSWYKISWNVLKFQKTFWK